MVFKFINSRTYIIWDVDLVEQEHQTGVKVMEAVVQEVVID